MEASGDGNKNISTAPLTNHGTIDWLGPRGFGTGSLFINRGTLNIKVPGTFWTSAGPNPVYFENHGTINTFAGINSMLVRVTNTGTINVGTGGTGTLNDVGDVANSGIINLGMGYMEMGRLDATSTSKINIDIGGTAETDFGRAHVGNNPVFAGELKTRFVNSFVPQAGDTFRVMTKGGMNRAFDKSTPQSVAGKTLSLHYTYGSVTLTAQNINLSINDISILEGNSGTANHNFTVSLSAPASQAVTVNYTTANGTATQPADYTLRSGTLTIPAGATRGVISVPVKGDVLDEANETFLVNLSAANGAVLADNQGIATILDNDATPTLSINDVTVTEGNAGTTTNAAFTITLSAASGQTVSVGAIPSNGTAIAPADYTAGGLRLTFTPGQTSKTFNVPVKGDGLDEVNELFYVLLSDPVNAALVRARGVGTIADDDEAPTISIEDLSIKEYNGGQTTAAFRLRLSAASGQVVRASYQTADGTATAGSDYGPVAPTQVSFSAGNLYAYARVLINGDELNELNEMFLVNLSAPINATIADNQALGTILDDDSAPALSINDVSIEEGNTGTKQLTFTVTLSKASGQSVSVNYATANGTAVSTSDYTAANGTLTFAPGSPLTQSVSITLNGDTTAEANETLFVLLSGATNATVSKARGTGTINNDDASG